MTTYILVFVLICVEAIFNACMDKTMHHYNQSVFPGLSRWAHRVGIFKSRLNADRWFSPTGWMNKYVQLNPIYGRVKIHIFGKEINKPVQLCDSWHFFKTLQLICILLAVSLSLGCKFEVRFGPDWLTVMTHVIILAVARNLVFSLFYNRILTKKNNGSV